MKNANQAGFACLESAIEWGIGGGEVVAVAGGAIIGGSIGRAQGAGIDILLGTFVNGSVDYAHTRHCYEKVHKMKKDAQDARDNCYKQAGVKPGDYNDN